jgi:hypothetical protein
MVNDQDGSFSLPLKLSEIVEQEADICRAVFVGAVEPDEWVEDEQARLEFLDGSGESLLVLGVVETKVVFADQANRQAADVIDAAGRSDGKDAVLDGMGRVLGRVE